MAGQAGHQVFNIMITVTLLHLLTPREFGLIGMITVFSGFSRVLLEVVIRSAIIQNHELTEEDESSIFWFNFALGLTIMLILMTASSLIADFYEEPQLFYLTLCIAPVYFFSALSTVQVSLYEKSLEFKVSALRRLVATVIAGIIAITMALSGFGVWSLVAQILSQAIFGSILIWLAIPWRPKLIFRLSAIRKIWEYSYNLFFKSSLNYFTKNIDNLLIGKVIGSATLGLYSKSFNIILIPQTNIVQIVQRVLFPALSSLQNDREAMKRLYFQANTWIAFLTIPLMFTIFFSAEPFTLLFFGKQWTAIIPLVKIFSIVGILFSLEAVPANVILATGNSKLSFKISLISKGITVAAIIIGLNWGIIGVATGQLVAAVSSLAITSFYFYRVTNIPVTRQIYSLLPFLLSALTCLIIIIPLEKELGNHLSALFRFSVIAGATGILYLALLYFQRNETVMQLVSILRAKIA